MSAPLWSEDRGALLTLTAAALSGLAARPRGGHGVPERSAEAIAAEAVELARATVDALDGVAPESPKPKKGR